VARTRGFTRRAARPSNDNAWVPAENSANTACSDLEFREHDFSAQRMQAGTLAKHVPGRRRGLQRVVR
jgi:hypothetical protein